ncbi:hypothetical protein ElyMa_000129800 [Elysia marginata]|uniref:Uncharacterized protein n=1 Tax=Elysia marginata TaxID=1093978 RepID=A0AAV4ENW2_9GAST|nr:hypothetical protein ElyMa_000129800 [Elysia marginata]
MLKSLVDFCYANIKLHSLHGYGGSPSNSMTASISPYSTITANPTGSLGLAGGGPQQPPSFPAPQPSSHLQSNFRRQRHLGRRDRHKTSLTLFPRSTITSLEGEESESRTRNRTVVDQQNLMTSVGGPSTGNSVSFGNRRQQSFMGDVSSILRERQARNYLPRTLTHHNIFPDNSE